MVTAGLLAAAASASAAPVSYVAGTVTPRLEAYTLTAGTAPNKITRTCTPGSLTTQVIMSPNFGTPPTVAFYSLQMNFAADCLPNS